MAMLLKLPIKQLMLFCQLNKKKVRRIFFADYAVRHQLQAVKELWGTLAAVRVHARYRSIHAIVDIFVYSVYGH